MNSINEIRAFLATINCGEAIFNIEIAHGSMNLYLKKWEEKDTLSQSTDIIKGFIGRYIERKFCKDTRLLVPETERLIDELYDYIQNTTIEMARETSPVDQPKRTSAYKDIYQITHSLKKDDTFVNDILPIINYYYQQKTDSKDKSDMVVHKNNVQALLNILRKKYGNKKKV